MGYSFKLSPPAFWYDRTARWEPVFLSPFTPITHYLSAHAIRKRIAHPVGIPVLCIGNLTVGGTGKTPIALSLAKTLKDKGEKVHFITRGYKGRLKQSTQVDLNKHSYREVGDEALLLAHIAPCWVGANRHSSATEAHKKGATCLIMDDGFQNTTLSPDFSLLVIDGQAGFGNGHLLPAGPLREPIERGLKRAEGIILIGQPSRELSSILAPYALPTWIAYRKPDPSLSNLHGQKILAFAGIGNPQQFFSILRNAHPASLWCKAFPDHYAYTSHILEKLITQSQKLQAQLVTTAKDACRIPASMHSLIHIVKTDITWEKEEAPLEICHHFLSDRSFVTL